MSKVRKAVLPVGGLGTRVLPATKAVPKELLPIFDKPALQYIVEEVVAAGVTEVIFVIGDHKQAIRNHFMPQPELEQALLQAEKVELHALVSQIDHLASYRFVRQEKPLGLGHAVLCAKAAVGAEPFVVVLGDDIVDPDTPCLPAMLAAYEQTASAVLCLTPLTPEVIPTYGIAAPAGVQGEYVRVASLVERPPLKEAPSDLGICGHYVLTPDIFTILERIPPGVNNEIQLTDALNEYARTGRCIGWRFTGNRYDTGNPLGMLEASIAFALKRNTVTDPLTAFIREHIPVAKP